MSSVAAANFARARSPETFKAWCTEEPGLAATFLKNVAATVATRELPVIDAFQTAPTPQGIEQLTALFSQLALANTQAARAPTLGWVADVPPKQAPALTGMLSVENGQPVLTTSAGTFECANASFFKLEGDDWRQNYTLGGHDVLAFAGRTVTVRGWPDASWKPGGRAALLVEEFAPGSSTDFVSGRVKPVGDSVIINVTPTKQVKVTNPDLAAALKKYDKLGVILPGPITEHTDGSFTYDGNPAGYYMLAGFWTNSTATEQLPDGRMRMQTQLAHGNIANLELPRRAREAGPERGQRHYMFGKVTSDGTLDVKQYTPNVGAWTASPGIDPSPSAAFAAHATNVETDAVEPFKPREATQAELLSYTQDQRWAGYPVGDLMMRRGFGMTYPEHAERLGKPLDEEHGDGADGAVQSFEHGRMLWNPRDGIRIEDT